MDHTDQVVRKESGKYLFVSRRNAASGWKSRQSREIE